MSSKVHNRFSISPWLLLAIGWAVLCEFAPWRQVHPSNAELGRSLSRAPLWSETYVALPGARIDVSELFLEAALIFFACGLFLAVFRTVRFRQI